MRGGRGSEAERDSVREAFLNGSRHLDFQTPFAVRNVRNVIVLQQRRRWRLWKPPGADGPPDRKCSRKCKQRTKWRQVTQQNMINYDFLCLLCLSGGAYDFYWSQHLGQICNFFSCPFLPSDGLLCVLAVGKSPVMVRSSHPTITQSHTPTPPPQHTPSGCQPSGQRCVPPSLYHFQILNSE